MTLSPYLTTCSIKNAPPLAFDLISLDIDREKLAEATTRRVMVMLKARNYRNLSLKARRPVRIESLKVTILNP